MRKKDGVFVLKKYLIVKHETIEKISRMLVAADSEEEARNIAVVSGDWRNSEEYVDEYDIKAMEIDND